MKENKRHYSAKRIHRGSLQNIAGQPETSFELINKYGTYEIQPTNDSDNEFPEIAQGLPKGKNSISALNTLHKSGEKS